MARNVTTVLLAASVVGGCPGGAANRRGPGAPGEGGGSGAVSPVRARAGRQARKARGQAQEAGGQDMRGRPRARGAARQVYFLDLETRTFHGKGCPRLGGRHGLQGVQSLAQALDAGYRPCPVCRPDRAYLVRVLGPAPKPPVAGPNAERACRRDSDCVLLPLPPCACPPCGWTWRQAVNRRHAKWLLAEWAKESCPPTPCRQCADPLVARLTPVLGTRAVCRGGGCQVE